MSHVSKAWLIIMPVDGGLDVIIGPPGFPLFPTRSDFAPPDDCAVISECLPVKKVLKTLKEHNKSSI
jgi:hypothetical protein